MKSAKNDLIRYRLERAYDTFEDAEILAERAKWNSSINRLYYSAYYAVMALLLYTDLHPTTHSGAKSNFSQYFIHTGKIDKYYGKIYSQLFTMRQKGDYDDLFNFTEGKVLPYFTPVRDLIKIIDDIISINS